MLPYNLVRLEMESIANEEKIEPTLRRNVKRYILPPRRPRSYPRFSKLNSSIYNRRKKPAKSAK